VPLRWSNGAQNRQRDRWGARAANDDLIWYVARVGTFTVLSADELSALAAEFSLGTVQSSRTIEAGTINSNFALETERGRFFLRVNEGKSEEDVAWEARLVGALADAGVATPKPIAARDGRLYAAVPGAATKFASAFPWRPGTHLHAGDVTPHHAHDFGRALATLHVAGLALPEAWRRTSIYDSAHLAKRFERIERERDPQLEHAQRVLRDELAVIASAAPVREAASHGIIHGDLFRDNVLWDGERISAILDFEQASGGSLAYDIAVCINDWCWDEREQSPRTDLAAALLRGYAEVRTLTQGDRAALPIELRASAMRFTITRITDVYLAMVDNPMKDFRAFLTRVETWRGPALQVLTSML
jgi:homoserine kinase type II